MLSGASCKEFKLFSKGIMVLLSPFLKDLSAWVRVYILLIGGMALAYFCSHFCFYFLVLYV